MYFSTRKACVEYLQGAIYQFAEKLAQVLPDEIDERSENTLQADMEEMLQGLGTKGESVTHSSGGICMGYQPSGHEEGMYEAILRYEITL